MVLVGQMLTSLDLVDCGCGRSCCLDLDEVDEPFDTGGCGTVVDPRGEAVGVASDVCTIKYDVECSWRWLGRRCYSLGRPTQRRRCRPGLWLETRRDSRPSLLG